MRPGTNASYPGNHRSRALNKNVRADFRARDRPPVGGAGAYSLKLVETRARSLSSEPQELAPETPYTFPSVCFFGFRPVSVPNRSRTWKILIDFIGPGFSGNPRFFSKNPLEIRPFSSLYKGRRAPGSARLGSGSARPPDFPQDFSRNFFLENPEPAWVDF